MATTLRPRTISSRVSSGTTRCSSIGGKTFFRRLDRGVTRAPTGDSKLARSCSSSTWEPPSCRASIIQTSTTKTLTRARGKTRQTTRSSPHHFVVCRGDPIHGEVAGYSHVSTFVKGRLRGPWQTFHATRSFCRTPGLMSSTNRRLRWSMSKLCTTSSVRGIRRENVTIRNRNAGASFGTESGALPEEWLHFQGMITSIHWRVELWT